MVPATTFASAPILMASYNANASVDLTSPTIKQESPKRKAVLNASSAASSVSILVITDLLFSLSILYPSFLSASTGETAVYERQTFGLCNGLMRRPHEAVAYYLVEDLPHGFMMAENSQTAELLDRYLDFIENPQDTPQCRTFLGE